jgi:hypothetical protein
VFLQDLLEGQNLFRRYRWLLRGYEVLGSFFTQQGNNRFAEAPHSPALVSRHVAQSTAKDDVILAKPRSQFFLSDALSVHLFALVLDRS